MSGRAAAIDVNNKSDELMSSAAHFLHAERVQLALLYISLFTRTQLLSEVVRERRREKENTEELNI